MRIAYKANKRIYADADAMRMMRIAKNCRMAIPNTNSNTNTYTNTKKWIRLVLVPGILHFNGIETSLEKKFGIVWILGLTTHLMVLITKLYNTRSLGALRAPTSNLVTDGRRDRQGDSI